MARKPAPSKAAPRKAAPRKAANSAAQETSLLEWIAGGVGLVLVLMVLAVIGSQALFGDRSPPALVVERLDVRPVAGGYLVGIKVTNHGGRSAAQAAVEGILATPGADPETGEATFDYVPGGSSREGGLFFQGDPSKGALTLRAKGYVDP